MWDALHEICEREEKSIAEIVTEADRDRRESSLTSAIRVFLLDYFRTRSRYRNPASNA